jgi:hypothetical protein
MHEVSYIASASPGYTSFKELKNLNQKLHLIQKQVMLRKEELLKELVATLKKVDTSDSIVSLGATSQSNSAAISRNSSEKALNNAGSTPEKHTSLSQSSSRSTSRNNSIQYDTISSSLGITVDGLVDDLKTKYDLTSYGSFGYPQYPYNQNDYYENYYNYSKSLQSNNNYSTKNRQAKVVNSHHDNEYEGYMQMAPDLYSKLANPHLQLNEISVMRFREALHSH